VDYAQKKIRGRLQVTRPLFGAGGAHCGRWGMAQGCILRWGAGGGASYGRCVRCCVLKRIKYTLNTTQSTAKSTKMHQKLTPKFNKILQKHTKMHQIPL